MFRSDRFEDVSLNQWMALTPAELVRTNVNASEELMRSLRKEKRPVVKYPVRPSRRRPGEPEDGQESR